VPARASILLPAVALLAATSSPVAAAQPAAAARPAPFGPGERLEFGIEYLHVHAGQATLLVGRPEGAVWPVICQARTEGLGALLDIREHFVSYWDAGSGLPRGSELNAIEIGDRRTERAHFDRESGKAVVRVVRRNTARESTVDVPRDVHDLASALLHLREQPLTPGSHLELPLFSGASTSTLIADVDGEETVETPAGKFPAVRVRLKLGFKDRFRTSRDSLVWFSKDPRHVPVRLSADFAVGSVTATLTAYRPGEQYTAR
jgi:Protein of unknown function (DUF3108)